MSDPRLDALGEDVKLSWHGFLDVFEPLRPELFRYCRYLTRSPWDAEDLVQDALMRAFVTLATRFHAVANPRAWLFRVASHLWIDRMRHARFEQPARTDELPEPPAGTIDPRTVREAGGTLMVRLSPQERAAVVLKDVFAFSLDEIASTLATTPNAIKAALHRGRHKLTAGDDPPARTLNPDVLDAFCAAFNARDLERLGAFLLDGANVEIVGLVTEYGPEEPKHPRTGSFAGSLGPITFDDRGGVAAELLADYLGSPPRCEVRAYRDGAILVFWFEHTDGPAVRCVMTNELDGDRVAAVRNYFFSPEVIAEVCRELGVPFRSNGYRYW